jgi:hypothetical protein
MTHDERVQRARRPGWEATEAKRFDPIALGVFHVSRRRRATTIDGKTYSPGLYLIDGLGRFWLCQTANYSKPVDAMVYENLTIKAEAELFLQLNRKTNHRPLDTFRIAVVAGEPREVAINEILARHGLAVGDAARSGQVRAVRSLANVYSLGGAALNLALGVIVNSWGSAGTSFDGAILEGVGKVCAAHPKLDIRGLSERLARVPNGAVGCKLKAEGYRSIKGGSLADACAAFVIDHYNRARSSRRLPSWRETASRASASAA